MNVHVNTDDAENAPPMQHNHHHNHNHHQTPMTVLSPKSGNIHNHNINNKNDNDTNKEKDQIFQLQIEIQSLKNRLKLSSSANKNDLLELLAEKDHVVQAKTKQIQTLNDKFHKITMAVAHMEREVKVLRKDNHDMESDNKKLKRHLNIREKEVTVLVTRCAAQEDKLAESKDSRILEKQLKEYRDKLQHSQQQLMLMEGVQESLVQSEAERNAAISKIDALTVERENLSSHIDDSKAQFEDQLQKRDISLDSLQKDLEQCRKLKEERDVECHELNTNLNDCRRNLNEMNQSMQNWKEEQNAKVQDLKQDKDGLCQDLNKATEEKEEMKIAGEEMTRLLEGQVQILTEELETKQVDIEKIEEEVRHLKSDYTDSVGEARGLKDKMRSLEEQIANMTERESQMVVADQSSAETIRGLAGEVEKMEEMATEMEHIYEEKMATLVKESAAMKEEYESILVESEDQFKEQDSQYETERLKVDKLQDEIDQINSHSARQQELRQLEIKILEESVKSAKEQMESKDKYAVSKVAEVKSERERVAKLESKVKILEDCSQQSELDAAAVVDELNLKLDRGTALKAKLEEERDRIVAESSKTMDKLQHKISSLESEFTDLKGEIVSKDSQLEHRQATVDSLMTVKGELEKKILSYRGDLETLMAAYDETKEEYSKNVREMKVDMDRDSSKFKSEYTELQIIATDSQEELEKLAASNDALQLTIAERSKTIEDLIRCSKDIEKEKAQAKSMLASVQERWQNHLKESEEFKRRATQLRIEKENEINSQLDTLDIVMTEKEELERKVQHLETKLEETKKQVKTTAELMAENYLLQDKIDRQDAFLKRKLLKEKVMKERMIPANPSSHPSLKSPPRVSSTRNISNRSRSTSTSRRSLDAPVPMPRQMSRQRSSSSRLDLRPIPSIDGLELQRSASDELDDLLNDDDGEV